MFRLSNIKPMKREIPYSVIHKSSAVNSKWRAVLVWITNVAKIRKKKKMKVFKSPKNKINL